MIFKKDNLQLGLVLGIIGPMIGLLVIYLIKFPGIGFAGFMEEFFGNNTLITSIGSLSLLANVALFTVYVNTQRDRTAKGIFLMTLLYGIGILILKVVN